MSFLDRLLNRNSSDTSAKPKVADDKKTSFFLDSDSSSSLGNVNYMREAKTITHTFPGTVSSPGDKKLVFEVDAMDAKLEERSQGLGGMPSQEEKELYPPMQTGVPKPVKKTFAEKITQNEMNRRLRGSAITDTSKNAPTAAKPTSAIPKTGVGRSNASGSIDPFRAMARDLNS